MARRFTSARNGVALLILAALLPGCSSFRDAVPASCMASRGMAASRSDKEPINFLRLRRDPPPAYQLGPRDVLGIYIEGILGSRDEPPPVHFPEQGDLPPAVGYPVPVREDGTISLPLIPPFTVEGLTLAQAEHRIRIEYAQERQILRPERDRIIVTLMKPRTYHVLVVREDTGVTPIPGRNPQRLAQSMALSVTKRGLSQAVELRAYENDVLHALSETGGLPGMDAKNEVRILRGAFSNDQQRNELLRRLETGSAGEEGAWMGPNVVRIPLRVGPYDPPLELTEEQITLHSGDIVFVESRETEVFYTGGLLPAGQFPLPRDYDIDVIEAIAMAGGKVATGAMANDDAFRGAAVGAIFPPTRAVVIRKLNGRQIPIAVDLKRAVTDPQERIRILPGDFIMLQYTPAALAGNVFISTFRINYLVNGGRTL